VDGDFHLVPSYGVDISQFRLHVFVIMCPTSMTVISWEHKNFYTKNITFINYCKFSHNFKYKYGSTWRDLIKKCISHPCCYGDVINNLKKFKSDISKFVKILKNLIKKCCELATIVHPLRQVGFATIKSVHLYIIPYCIAIFCSIWKVSIHRHMEATRHVVNQNMF
jgi:hypothetical protein